MRPEGFARRARLLYILSTGRSGSTLLESLLATHPDLASAGELQLLSTIGGPDDPPCACGRTVPDCPFWSQVQATAPPGRDLFRETRDAGRVLRIDWLPTVLTGRTLPWHRAALGAYTRRARATIEAVATASGRPIVVDASKDLYRLAALAATAAPPQVIWLVRDPRGFVSSVTGARDRPPGWGRITRVALRWTTQAVLMGALCRRLRRQSVVVVVRYEDLAGDPDGVLAELAGRLGLAPDFDVVGFHDHDGHAVAGNPMRRRDEPVALDRSWLASLDPARQRLVWALTATAAHRFGYRRHPQSEAAAP